MSRVATKCVAAWLLATAALAAPDGRVIAIADEWLLADTAFQAHPADTTALALNCASFLMGASGSVLVYSNNFSLTGAALANTMTGAGYNWTVSTAQPISMALLSQFDAVYLSGSAGAGAANGAILAQYVAAGGSALVCSGTGELGGGSGEAAAWNPLLNAFGLSLSGEWFPVAMVISLPLVPNANSVASGVSTIAWGFGHTVSETVPSDPDTDVILADFSAYALGNLGVIGTYGARCPGPCPGDLDGNGMVDGADLGVLLGAWGATVSPADLNCDGIVDGGDLGLLVAAWGACG